VPLIRSLYAAATAVAGPALRLLLRRRVKRGKELPARLPERWGEDDTIRPPGRLLWLHAASIGETVSVLPVLSALHQMAGDVGVLFTTGTVTSAEMLAQRLPELGLQGQVTHRFVPLDVPAWSARFLDHWRPDAAAFVESEIWPNLLAGCQRRGIKLMLLNARLSPRSFARWRRMPGFARAAFGAFDRVQAQSAEDAERLRGLGARQVSSPGNLKFAALPLPVPRLELQRVRLAIAGRPVWLAASTHPGEEAAVFGVHAELIGRHPQLLTIVVPRHPQRGPEIAAAAGSIPLTRRSLGEPPPAGAGVWLADTLGELGLFYSAAGIAFVGGSLVAHGGQNPLEPARLGCAVVVGPHTHNFAEPVATLIAAGALDRVADAAGLARWLDALLSDGSRRQAMGAAGIAAARRHGDLPRQTAAALLEMLPAGGRRG
jgi:3-deoxy-D-manno-octulosonic-acid transferase